MSTATKVENPSDPLPGRMAFDLEPEVCAPVGSRLPPLRRRREAGPAPLSVAQERLWFLDKISAGDVSANISRGARISGDLDVGKLKEAVQSIVTRHESLRTTFAKNELQAGVDGQPLQFVREATPAELPVIKLNSLPESDREERAREIAREAAQCAFDLTLGPLWRLMLLQLNDSDWVLLLNTHRIICDEFSTEIFFDEVWLSYQSLLSKAAPRAESLPVQYADYAAWQREWLQSDMIEGPLAYWRKKLAGAPTVLELPSDRTRPAVQTWHGATASMVLGKGLTADLRALSKREGTSLFVTLLSAFQALLARYSQQADIVVGSVIENREIEETWRLIGPVANLLPLRADLVGNPSFRSLLKQVCSVVSEARLHFAPFEKLLEELRLSRSLSHAPLFQVMLNLKPEPPPPHLELAELIIEDFPFENSITQFDLTLNIAEQADQLQCYFEYNTDLLDETTIERMGGHLRMLLADVVRNPERRIEELALLTREERSQLLQDWNPAPEGKPGKSCMQDLFAAGVERHPDSCAVAAGDVRLTYRELDARSSQLANYLRKHGVGPEVPVGVCLERSAELITALLAVLKAGGAYVPLDPEYPTDRLSFMLRDSQVPVLISQSSLWADLSGDSVDVILLDHDWARVVSESTEAPRSPATPENLAYIIYTSGSTGSPKGVGVTHASAVHLFEATREQLGLREGDVWTTVHSSAFDFSVWEIWGCLLQGGQLVVPPLETIQSPSSFLDLLRRERVTILSGTPALLRQLLETRKQREEFASDWSVRRVICGGDALDQDLALELVNLEGHAWNFYGPTESTVWATLGLINEVAQTEVCATSIGRPISGIQIYLLNEQLQPAPIGVAGELYIAGAGLARGYRDRPALTAERFLPNPFSKQSSARMYRTGDAARYHANGKIEFLGRLDHQVKLRGFRIELGEIESVLSQHAGVRQAVVVLREDQVDDKRLVAYVRASGADAPSTNTLREYLQKSLPDYMVPSAFVMLDALPLTTNGKVDRRALPPPDDSRPDLSGTYAAPRDNTEAQLTKLWEKVLGLKRIGIRDNFFELGGHSLLAARLFAQIDNRFRRNLPLATLFQAPTIEQLATVLRASDAEKEWSSLVPIQPKGSRPPLFCVHAAGANVLIYRPLARHLGMDQPVYAFQARGLDGQTAPYGSVEDMAAHYLRELRAFQPEGPYLLLGASFGGLVIFEMAQRLLSEGQQVALLGLLNTNCPVFSVGKRLRCHLGHLKERGPKTYLRFAAGALMRKAGRNLPSSAKAVGPDRGLQEAIESKADQNDPLVRTVLAILQAESDYAPKRASYPGKITFFWARDAGTDYEDNRLGWRKLAKGGFEIHEIPGGHTTMREEPHVAVLVEKLRPCLLSSTAGHCGAGGNRA